MDFGPGEVFVALRKESVDRNRISRLPRSGTVKSLSARRAWIEIPQRSIYTTRTPVALRKESVDRNFFACVGVRDADRRSPQGERG